MINEEILAWLALSFDPYKSAGPNGIFSSVETVVHEVVGTVESALDKKEYVLASFLDIEQSFNNVKISSILEYLGGLEIDQSFVK